MMYNKLTGCFPKPGIDLLVWLAVLWPWMPGCSSAKAPVPPTVVYIPYVETVEFPERVVAGEAFTATLVLSCAKTPDLLDGLSAADLGPEGLRPCVVAAGDYPSSLMVSPVVYDFRRKSGTPVNRFDFTITATTAGTCHLQVSSADTPEWGGVGQRTAGGDAVGGSQADEAKTHIVVKTFDFVATAN